ncbi:MAG: glycosyltransferase [Eubacteriales bacterium]
MISLIIPIYNEKKIISSSIVQIKEYMDKVFGSDWECIISDDGSTDGSVDIARRHEDGRLHVISYAKNRGKGCAVRTGIMSAKGDYIFYTDCDLAYGLDVLSQGMDVFRREGCDIVIGSRHIDAKGYASYPFMRKVMSWVFRSIVIGVGGLRVTDSQCGIKGFRRECGLRIFSECTTDGFSFDFEALMHAQKQGWRISEMPVHIINHRESKINVIKDSVRMFRDLFRIRGEVNKKYSVKSARQAEKGSK